MGKNAQLSLTGFSQLCAVCSPVMGDFERKRDVTTVVGSEGLGNADATFLASGLGCAPTPVSQFQQRRCKECRGNGHEYYGVVDALPDNAQ